jgi:hypothetical protein
LNEEKPKMGTPTDTTSWLIDSWSAAGGNHAHHFHVKKSLSAYLYFANFV